MRQENIMVLSEKSIVVMPPVYEIKIGWWRWCKLQEVCAVVPNLALLAGVVFAPTPEELVSLFSGLVRPNRLPKEDTRKVKVFRYSRDGEGFWGTEVPKRQTRKASTPFSLEIEKPYPIGLFVPEGWVIDTLKAIRIGIVEAADYGDYIVGWRLEGDKRGHIWLKEPAPKKEID
jgi:hypothetical protein